MMTLDQLSRVAIVGTSCAGKSTLARTLAHELSLSHIELDALYWGPNWTPLPRDALRDAVDRATAQPRWICDGNYRVVRDLVWQRASAIIWLNFSFPFVFRRALARTLARCTHRTPLFAGNRETFRKSFFSRDSILLWVLQSHWRIQREFPLEFREPQHAHLRVIQLRSAASTARFLSEVRQMLLSNAP